MSKRGRMINAKGRFQRGETFAIIPVDVLTCDAYAALPDYAARVLIALAAQYRGTNNGDLSLTREQAATLGIGSAWKVTAGLKLLTVTGLIRRTREGRNKHGKGVCALYGVSWKHLDPTPQAYPPIEHERPASSEWASWAVPDDWDAIVRNAKRASKGVSIFSQTPRGEQLQTPREERKIAADPAFRPHVRTENDERAISFQTPRGCNPLELPPGGAGSLPESDPPVLASEARKRGRPRNQAIARGAT